MKFLEITTCSKLQVTKTYLIFVLKGIPNQKKCILKITIACFNTNLISLCYERWHICNPDIFIIRGIFRALEYLKVRRYVHDASTFNVFFHFFFIYSKRFQYSCPLGKLPHPHPTLQLTLPLTLTLTRGGGSFPCRKLPRYHVPSNVQYTSTMKLHASTYKC